MVYQIIPDINKMKCENCGREFESEYKGAYCSSCLLERQKIWGLNSSTKRMIRNRDFVKNYKKDKKCEICGYNKYPEILVFHHKNKREKNAGINNLMKMLKNIDCIEKEIGKCILICPNCHRELHIQENQ